MQRFEDKPKYYSCNSIQALGEPSEIAHAVLYLASAKASYIHGTELKVDAGFQQYVNE
ncbi:MAG: SDR family oxidoreductase [Prolixibacteraceae bacterium]|nr:SDR family oxidoreductase [Prolixibacteraceae bacterium]